MVIILFSLALLTCVRFCLYLIIPSCQCGMCDVSRKGVLGKVWAGAEGKEGSEVLSMFKLEVKADT
jgi:hypothetical protein